MICRIEEREAGRSYPRTCPTCGLSKTCAKGLDHRSLVARIVALEAENHAIRAEMDRLHTKAMVAVDKTRNLEHENARLRAMGYNILNSGPTVMAIGKKDG